MNWPRRIPSLFVFAAFLFGQTTTAFGQVQRLTDDPAGVGCTNYSVAGGYRWKKPLGDWLDRAKVLHGDAAYSTAAVGRSALADGVRLDVGVLVNQWLDGTRPNTGVMLRALEGHGVVQFSSREAKEGRAPMLELEWASGEVDRLKPRADVTLDCSTYKGIGRSARLRVSPEVNTLVVFDLPNSNGRTLRAARLWIYPEKLFGKPLTIGVFSAQPPWADPSEARRDGLVAGHSSDKEVARHPDVLFTADFEGSDWLKSWHRMTRSEVEIVDQAEGNGFQPISGKALKTTLKKGANTALNLRYLFSKWHDEEPEEIYFRYYLRFGADWNADKDGGKLPGLAGTYGKAGWGPRQSDGTNGWSVRGAFSKSFFDETLQQPLTPVGSIAYHSDMTVDSGVHWGWGQGPGGLLQNNRWYAIEQYVRLNTPGQHDGVFRAWIDGRKVIERTSISFRTVPDLRIESVWMNVYHGGTASSPRDMSLYIDNIAVARSYIGQLAIPAGGR